MPTIRSREKKARERPSGTEINRTRDASDLGIVNDRKESSLSEPLHDVSGHVLVHEKPNQAYRVFSTG